MVGGVKEESAVLDCLDNPSCILDCRSRSIGNVQCELPWCVHPSSEAGLYAMSNVN